MKTYLLIATIAAGMALAATAEARGERTGPMMPTFEELDADANGSVTLTEIETALTARAEAQFAERDTDGDGALSADEMMAGANAERAERMAERIARHIERADENGDGLLQQSELQAQADNRRGGNFDRMFDRLDADEDGVLTAEEFAEARERMHDHGRRGRP